MHLLISIPWVIAGIACWIGFQLVRQNGRILLQLESFEKRLEMLSSALSSGPQTMHSTGTLPLGSVAPGFELPELSGKRRNLNEWRGRQILLIFFNPKCGFCIQMAPQIADISKNTDVVPVLISTGTVAENKKLAQEHSIDSTVLLQSQMEVAATYNVAGTPIGYLVDKDGKIASEMAVGADALLQLARSSRSEAANSHANQPTSDGSRPNLVKKADRDLSRSSIQRDGLRAGVVAPSFTLPRVDGGELSLESFRGRPLLLVFSDPDCGPCQALAPDLNRKYQFDSMLEVLMISRGDLLKNRVKAQEQNLRFPIVLQRQWEISRLYGMFATPIAYYIDEHGIIADQLAIGADPILALFTEAGERLKAAAISK